MLFPYAEHKPFQKMMKNFNHFDIKYHEDLMATS